VLFECSGTALERVEHATRFLSSSSFARALIDKRKDSDNLKAGAANNHVLVHLFTQ